MNIRIKYEGLVRKLPTVGSATFGGWVGRGEVQGRRDVVSQNES